MNVHFRHIILSLVASVLFAACQDMDVPEVQPEETGRAENSITTYLNIQLRNVDEISSRGESGDYTEGTTEPTDEFTIDKVDFYFFYEDGNAAKVNNILNPTNRFSYNLANQAEDDDDANNNNIESTWPSGNNPNTGEPRSSVLTLILKEGEPKPKWMIAVANSDKTYDGVNLKQIEKEIVIGTEIVGDYKNSKGKFIMASSSFYDAYETDNSKTHPYAVKIDEKEDYFDYYQNALDKPVSVYIERLAAKVTLKTDLKVNDDQVVEIDNIMYKPGEKVKAKIKLHAWGLNATAKESLLMKQIDNWDFKWGKNGSWNNENDHRSYWGKSLNYTYDETDYANSGSAGGFDSKTGGDKNATDENYVLSYHSLNDYFKDNKLGTYGSIWNTDQYTLEHTLSEDHLKAMYQKDGRACATSVILIAQLLELGDTKVTEGSNLYRMNGLFYTEEDLIKYLYSLYKNKDNEIGGEKISGPNAWVKIENNDIEDGDITFTVDGVQYKQIDAKYFTLGDIGDGLVGLVVTQETAKRLNEGTIYVYYNKIMYKYDFYKEEWGYQPNQLIEGFYKDLRKHNEDHVIPLNINGFKDGWMYYQIPIEHLAPFEDGIKYNNVNYINHVAEGQYGVVRNHWYQITVNKISGLGWGIFDPEEMIVPQPRTDKVGIGFEMQVGNWHVKQYGVTLDGTTETGTGKVTEEIKGNENNE